MDKTTKEILTEARSLITDPAKWTQKVYSRNSAGLVPDHAWDSEAVCWCSWGALEKIQGTYVYSELPAFSALKKTMNNNVGDFNDNHTHEEVLEAFDKAIKLCKEE